jgi:hypothetical protein
MGIVLSLILVAAGAILTWAVTFTANGINLHTVGVILMVVGVIGFVLSLILWSTWFGPGYWGQRSVPTATSARRTVVEEDVAPR